MLAHGKFQAPSASRSADSATIGHRLQNALLVSAALPAALPSAASLPKQEQPCGVHSNTECQPCPCKFHPVSVLPSASPVSVSVKPQLVSLVRELNEAVAHGEPLVQKAREWIHLNEYRLDNIPASKQASPASKVASKGASAAPSQQRSKPASSKSPPSKVASQAASKAASKPASKVASKVAFTSSNSPASKAPASAPAGLASSVSAAASTKSIAKSVASKSPASQKSQSPKSSSVRSAIKAESKPASKSVSVGSPISDDDISEEGPASDVVAPPSTSEAFLQRLATWNAAQQRVAAMPTIAAFRRSLMNQTPQAPASATSPVSEGKTVSEAKSNSKTPVSGRMISKSDESEGLSDLPAISKKFASEVVVSTKTPLAQTVQQALKTRVPGVVVNIPSSKSKPVSEAIMSAVSEAAAAQAIASGQPLKQMAFLVTPLEELSSKPAASKSLSVAPAPSRSATPATPKSAGAATPKSAALVAPKSAVSMTKSSAPKSAVSMAKSSTPVQGQQLTEADVNQLIENRVDQLRVPTHIHCSPVRLNLNFPLSGASGQRTFIAIKRARAQQHGQ